MRRLLGIFCGVALVCLLGCQVSQTGAPGPRAAGQEQVRVEQEARELREMKQAIERYGLTMTSLAEEIKRQSERSRAETGPPEIVKDLWPTQRVLATAMQAAQLQKTDETLHLLSRLDALVQALYSDLPASQIITRCERALVHLQLPEPNLEEASGELTIAYDVAHDPKLPKLRPAGVDALIQTNAKAQINAGRPTTAIEVVETVLVKCADHWSLQMLERVRAGILAAEAAVAREKWPVVEAELMEVHRELTDLAEEVHLQGYAAATAEAEGGRMIEAGEEQPEAGAEAEAEEEMAAPETPVEGEEAPPEAAAPEAEAEAAAEAAEAAEAGTR